MYQVQVHSDLLLLWPHLEVFVLVVMMEALSPLKHNLYKSFIDQTREHVTAGGTCTDNRLFPVMFL